MLLRLDGVHNGLRSGTMRRPANGIDLFADSDPSVQF
jgi:hypothetical protein